MTIPGGYLLLSRKLIESEIFDKPPLYVKVWIYLLSQAQHKKYKKLDRGQLFTSIPEIQEACCWYVGYRKETPSKSKIYRIIDWLRKTGERADEQDTNNKMIETTKATQGMVITILNYGYYQDPKNYERNGDKTDERTPNTTRPKHSRNNINNNENNEDKEMNKYADEISAVYETWIELLDDVNNARLTKKQKETILTKIKKWSKEELIAAIENYNEIYRSEFYYSHSFTMYKFIKQKNGAPRFKEGLDQEYDGDIWKDYKNNKTNAGSNNYDPLADFK